MSSPTRLSHPAFTTSPTSVSFPQQQEQQQPPQPPLRKWSLSSYLRSDDKATELNGTLDQHANEIEDSQGDDSQTMGNSD
jgi:hypothetical protein